MTERRPRIPADLAAKLDERRWEEESFEALVRRVLTNFADHTRPPEEPGESVIEISEGSAAAWIVRDGWNNESEEILAGLAVADAEYEPVGIHLTKNDIRALRDACTELLGEYA